MAKKLNLTYVTSVNVVDPDSKAIVNVIIAKMETGGMIGIDASFLENTEENVYSPYDKGVKLNVDNL